MPRKPIDEDEDALSKARTRTNEVINRTQYWFSLQKNIKFFHMCKVCKIPFNSIQHCRKMSKHYQRTARCAIAIPKIGKPTQQSYPGFWTSTPRYWSFGILNSMLILIILENQRMFTRTRWPTALINDDTGVSESKFSLVRQISGPYNSHIKKTSIL